MIYCTGVLTANFFGRRLLALGLAPRLGGLGLPGLPNLESLQDLLGCMALVGAVVVVGLMPLEWAWPG